MGSVNMPVEGKTASNAIILNTKGEEEELISPQDKLVIISAGSYS